MPVLSKPTHEPTRNVASLEEIQEFYETGQAYMLGLQITLPRSFFAQLLGNAGTLYNESVFLQNIDGFRCGFGLLLGKQTVMGPIKLGLTAPDPTGPYEIAVSIGYAF